MKSIYNSPSLELGLQALDEFENKWNSKYSYAIKSLRNNDEFDEIE